MKHPSDCFARLRACHVAQPTQPPPNLCPTSETLGHMGLPNLPNLLSSRVYARDAQGLSLYMRVNRLGRLGRSGRASNGAGFDCPTSALQVGQVGQGGMVHCHAPGSSPARPHAGRTAAKPREFPASIFGSFRVSGGVK